MIEDLIQRYKNLLISGKHSPTYWKNKGHWISEIDIKVKQLEKIIKKQ